MEAFILSELRAEPDLRRWAAIAARWARTQSNANRVARAVLGRDVVLAARCMYACARTAMRVAPTSDPAPYDLMIIARDWFTKASSWNPKLAADIREDASVRSTKLSASRRSGKQGIASQQRPSLLAAAAVPSQLAVGLLRVRTDAVPGQLRDKQVEDIVYTADHAVYRMVEILTVTDGRARAVMTFEVRNALGRDVGARMCRVIARELERFAEGLSPPLDG